MNNHNKQLIWQPRWFTVVALIPISLIFWVSKWPPVDDAYTTFRYAWNLSNGKGFVYNIGDNVLGTTTPLWALFLGLANYLGADLETFSVVVSLISILLLWFFIAGFLPKAIPLHIQFTLGSLFVLYLPVSATVSSGMESIVYILVVTGALLSCAVKNYRLSALFSAIATLIRPDGILTAVILGVSILISRQYLFSSSVIYLLCVLPWGIFSWVKFGSLAPQSIVAKQLIHPSSPWMNMKYIAQALSINLSDFFIVCIGTGGAFYRAITRKEWIFISWFILYCLGLVFSGVKPIFYWYFAPIWIFIIGYGSIGIISWCYDKDLQKASSGKILSFLVSLGLLVSVVFSLYKLNSDDPEIRRHQLYRKIGASFVSIIPKEDIVYLCETGILGYYLKENRVIDSAGINSNEALVYRKRAREELISRSLPYAPLAHYTFWGVDLVKDQQPDWIISPRGWCHLSVLERTEWFYNSYDRVLVLEYPELDGIAVYKKRS